MSSNKFLIFFLFICIHAISYANSPLTTLNQDFHDLYNQRVQQIIQTFGSPQGRPIIMNLGGSLIFKYNGQKEVVSITPEAYHILKTFSHASFSMALSLSKLPDGKLSPNHQHTLRKIQKDLLVSSIKINQYPLSIEEKWLCKRLVSLTHRFINMTLTQNYYARKNLNHYYLTIQPVLKQTIKKATEEELAQLDLSVTQWLKKLTPTERQKLSIVVAAPHQARAGEVSLQYFTKLLNIKLAEGAVHEKNLVVLEGKFDEASALALLARHFLDRTAAKLILQDEEGLQRDLLGDAASDILHNYPKHENWV